MIKTILGDIDWFERSCIQKHPNHRRLAAYLLVLLGMRRSDLMEMGSLNYEPLDL